MRTRTRTRTRLRVSALAALPAAVLLAGCGGGAGAAESEPELGPVEVNPATAALVLPMDAYTDTEAESIRMGQVQQRLLSRCMARYGFAYEEVRPADGAAAGGSGPADRHRTLFGAADLAYAAAYGYDPTGGAGSRAKPAAPELSDSAYVVMNGEQRGSAGGRAPDAMTEEEAAGVESGLSAGGQKVPAGGCGREAYRKLYAPTKDSVDLLFTFGLAAEAHDRSKNDSRVLAVLGKWSACMGRSGYSGIKTPYDVIEELGLQGEQGGPRAVNAAKADVACKQEVNLVGIWAAVEKAYQERLVEQHAETLARYKAQREARFRLAATIS
ncbi:hypothetical protein ACWGDE_02105 [Streptomyces sp. NPDC054956]